MKRVYISVAILAVIISMNFASLSYIRRSVFELKDMIAGIQYSVSSDEFSTAQERLDDFCKKWYEKEDILVRLVRHPGIDNATNVISELPYLLEYQNYSVFMSKMDMANSIITRIWEDEVPILQNIM